MPATSAGMTTRGSAHVPHRLTYHISSHGRTLGPCPLNEVPRHVDLLQSQRAALTLDLVMRQVRMPDAPIGIDHGLDHVERRILAHVEKAECLPRRLRHRALARAHIQELAKIGLTLLEQI